jgi:hypothetical protein
MDVCQTTMACLYQDGAGLSSTVRLRKGKVAWSRGAYLLRLSAVMPPLDAEPSVGLQY